MDDDDWDEHTYGDYDGLGALRGCFSAMLYGVTIILAIMLVIKKVYF